MFSTSPCGPNSVDALRRGAAGSAVAMLPVMCARRAPRAARRATVSVTGGTAACRAAHSYSLCIPGCIAAGVRRVGAALMFVIVATLIAASIGLLDWFRSDVAVLSLCEREWVGWGAVHGGAAPLGTAPTAALCTPSARARQAWQRLTCPCREQRATDCDMGGRHS